MRIAFHILWVVSLSPLFPFLLPSLPSLPPSLPSSLCVSLSLPLFLLFFLYLILSLLPLCPILHSFLQDPKQVWNSHREKAPSVYSKNEHLVQKSMHRSWKFLVAHQVYEPFQHIWALLDTLPISNGMGNGRNYTPAGVAGTPLSVPAGDFFTPPGKASRVFRS